MIACSLCNAPTSLEEGTSYTTEELEQAAARGFGPPDSAVRAALAAGWSREQVMVRWQQQLAESAMPYWLLCPACAARAARYMPRPAGAGPEPARAPDRETPRYVPKSPAGGTAGAPVPPWLMPEPTPPPSAPPPESPPWSAPAPTSARPAVRSTADQAAAPTPARPAIRSIADQAAAPAPARPAIRSIAGRTPPPAAPAAAESAPSAPAPPLPPPGLDAEQSARIRQKTAPRSWGRDPLLIGTIVVVVGLVVGLIFLASGRFRSSGAPTPFPTIVPTGTPGPTRPRASPQPTSTLSTTAKALLQTRAALPDLVTVTLTLADMPAGFAPMSPDALAAWGLAGSDLEKPLEGTIQAVPHNPAGFMFLDPPSFEFVIVYLVYPLTEREQADFDREVATQLVTLTATLPEVKNRRSVAPLPGGDRFGDKSYGYTMLVQGENRSGRLEMLMIRRGAVVAVIQSFYMDGNAPLMGAVKAAGILDRRMGGVLGPTPLPTPTATPPLTPTAVITATPGASP